MLDGSQHADGATWRDGCNTCRCAGGRATCLPVSCDCSAVAPRADPGCCPQCYDQQVCRHQRIPGLAYTSGQRWIHDCMECECMVSAVILYILDSGYPVELETKVHLKFHNHREWPHKGLLLVESTY